VPSRHRNEPGPKTNSAVNQKVYTTPVVFFLALLRVRCFRLNRSSRLLGSVHNDCDAPGANRTRRNLSCHHGLNATSPVRMHYLSGSSIRIEAQRQKLN
jgi:hypothetical protein